MNLCLIGGGNKEAIITEVVDWLEKPSVLILPTACSTEYSYARKVGNCVEMFKSLGVAQTVLNNFGVAPTVAEMDEKFGGTNMIYALGGHSPTMMCSMRQQGLDSRIKNAITNSHLYSGSSAGALAVFNKGFICPAKNPKQEDWRYEFLDMLSVIDATATVHADGSDPTKYTTRLEHFSRMLPKNHELALGIDNFAALAIRDRECSVIRTGQSPTVHIVQDRSNRRPTVPIYDNFQLTEILGQALPK